MGGIWGTAGEPGGIGRERPEPRPADDTDAEGDVRAILGRAALLSLDEIRALASRAFIEQFTTANSRGEGVPVQLQADRAAAANAVGKARATELRGRARESIALAGALARTTGGGLGRFSWAARRRAAESVEDAALAEAARATIPPDVHARLMQPWRDVVELHLPASTFEGHARLRTAGSGLFLGGLTGLFGFTAAGFAAQRAGLALDVTIPFFASVATLLVGSAMVIVWRRQIERVADARSPRVAAFLVPSVVPAPPTAAPVVGPAAAAEAARAVSDPEGDSCLASLAGVPGAAVGLLWAVGASGITVTEEGIWAGLFLLFGWCAIAQIPGMLILDVLERLDRHGFRKGRDVRNATDGLGYVLAFACAALLPGVAFAVGGWTGCLVVGLGFYPIAGLWLAYALVRRGPGPRSAAR